MSIDAVASKRLRRTFEPEEKAWHDDALELPWEDVEPKLHKATVFSLKNVFFFSHATPVQAAALTKFVSDGESAIIEAPTGSGKTLAFLIPLMERAMRSCEAYVSKFERPPLNRNICGLIISPSRTLAEQTFVVAKNLASRYPYNIQFALCDGVMEQPAAVVERLKNGARGAGTFIVTTPQDLSDLLPLLDTVFENKTVEEDDFEQMLAEQDEETRRRYLAKKKARSEGNNKNAGSSSSLASKGSQQQQQQQQSVQFYSSAEHRFVVVVDEADLVFNSPEMRRIVTEFIEQRLQPPTLATKEKSSPKKRAREAASKAAAGLHVDYAFVGATVATSCFVKDYAESLCKRSVSELNLVTSRSNDNFISQLHNRYIVCDAHSFLPIFVQMMNLHASKKHFVFFNNFRALLFVQKLFSHLTQGPRPILFVKDVYVMYEGMTENARILQYNKFLTHKSSTNKSSTKKAALSDAEKKNQIFSGGWKRDGKAPMGTGAILLCTDIAAFGLDVRDVDYVYHFEPPSSVRSYIHRVGRVGRMGMKGSSILLLPCIADSGAMVQVRERKTTSTRFNTVANTKNSTSELKSNKVSADQLEPERKQYVEDLSVHASLEEYNIPPFAPITSTLRNVMLQDDKLQKLAKAAAMSMCETKVTEGGEEKSWFSPKLALRSLLLD